MMIKLIKGGNIGFLDTLKEVITNKPLILREPSFIWK